MDGWAIGISTGCCWKTKIFDCLADISAHGFQLIEICSHPNHLDYRDLPLVRRAASMIQSLGLNAYSFHAPFSEAIDITAPDDLGRAETERELMRAADAAAILDVKYFVLHPGPERAAIAENEGLIRLSNAAGVLKQLYHYCRRLGMQLVLENMLPHLFAGRTRNLTHLMGMLKDTDIGICVDTGHAQLGGNLREIIEFSKPCIRLVHASDNYGNRDDHLAPGDGIIDWPPVLRQLVEIGYSGALIVEIADFEDRESTLRGACRGREYLRHVAGTIDLSAAKEAALTRTDFS